MARASCLSEETIEANCYQAMKVLRKVTENSLIATSAHQWHAVWLHAWTQHRRCHIHCTPATRKNPCLEKTLDCVPRLTIWWALCKLGIEKWSVCIIQTMDENTRIRMDVGCNMNEEFAGVHQGSCLSPLLFITVLAVLGAPSEQFHTGCPCKNLWISGGIAREVDSPEVWHGRKGTYGQHRENQGPGIWAVASYASNCSPQTPSSV